MGGGESPHINKEVINISGKRKKNSIFAALEMTAEEEKKVMNSVARTAIKADSSSDMVEGILNEWKDGRIITTRELTLGAFLLGRIDNRLKGGKV